MFVLMVIVKYTRTHCAVAAASTVLAESRGSLPTPQLIPVLLTCRLVAVQQSEPGLFSQK